MSKYTQRSLYAIMIDGTHPWKREQHTLTYLPKYIIPLLLEKKLRHRTAREPKPIRPPNININLFDSTMGLRHLLHVYGSLCCHYLLTESSESEQKILGTSVGPCLEGDPANAIKSSEVKTRQDMTRDNSQ